jgi:ferredoxin
MPKVLIDNIAVDVPEGATILDAARQVGIDIPTLCYREGQPALTSCLVCVVKVGTSSRLVPSCATRVVDGMVISSETDEVRAARRTALELLLGDHAGDCVGPCQGVCPAHMNIPSMIHAIAGGRLRDAVAIVKAAIPLPATLGRICPELCERGCRRGAMDEVISICQLKRFVGDADLASGDPWLPPVAPPTGKRVAIVGAGPAGLSAAWFLLCQGHAVSVFDAHELPGGALRYSIGEGVLPRAVLDAEIGLIEKLGAKLVMNRRVASATELAELRQQFDAVLLALGTVDVAAAKALGLSLAGRGIKSDRKTCLTDLPGVFVAGGAVVPLKHAVRAVADGHSAAAAIGDWLAGRAIRPLMRPFTVHLGALREGEMELVAGDAVQAPRVAAAGGKAVGFAVEEAVREAVRCLRCNCAKEEECRLRRYAEKYHADPNRFRGDRRPVGLDASHPLLSYDEGKCIACGICVQMAGQAGEALGLSFRGRGLAVRVSVPFGGKLSEGLVKLGREVAAACPTAAIAVKEGK